jgi:hypothetical protein
MKPRPYNPSEWRYVTVTNDARNTREFFEHRKLVLARGRIRTQKEAWLIVKYCATHNVGTTLERRAQRALRAREKAT